MIKISILYPNKEGSWFDMEYFITRHLPMAIKYFSGMYGFRGISVEKGLGNDNREKEPAFIVICNLLFDSIENFFAAFNPQAGILEEDATNYTDIKPIFHLSEKISLEKIMEESN
jgi:uncharacterized protein (TIGR02118 family)